MRKIYACAPFLLVVLLVAGLACGPKLADEQKVRRDLVGRTLSLTVEGQEPLEWEIAENEIVSLKIEDRLTMNGVKRDELKVRITLANRTTRNRGEATVKLIYSLANDEPQLTQLELISGTIAFLATPKPTARADQAASTAGGSSDDLMARLRVDYAIQHFEQAQENNLRRRGAYANRLDDLLMFDPTLVRDPEITFIFGEISQEGYTFTVAHPKISKPATVRVAPGAAIERLKKTIR